MSNYPAGTDSLVNPLSTDVTSVVDHAANHTNANNAIMAVESNMGTNSGTNIHKSFVAGNFPARINSSNVLQQNLQGTVNNSTFGTPAITGGTIASTVYNNGIFGTPAITGGTANAQTLGTPIVNVWNGWVNANEAWTIVGTSAQLGTIGLPLTATTKYDKGDKLLFTQNGTSLYMYVSDNPGTTIVVTAGTQYVLGTFAISANQYSKMQSPNGFPQNFGFTTTYTGFINNPTPPTFFTLNGKTAVVTFGASNEGTSNAGTLLMTVPIPAANITGLAYKILGRAVDNGAENIGIASLSPNSSTLTCYKTTDGSGWTASAVKAWQGIVTYFI